MPTNFTVVPVEAQGDAADGPGNPGAPGEEQERQPLSPPEPEVSPKLQPAPSPEPPECSSEILGE